MPDFIAVQTVPKKGPLSVGSVYPRAELHGRFGGNRYTGIVPSVREPVVLLFHTKEPGRQFYRDGFDEQGVYWYSGEGSAGDMRWNATNRAIRDHQTRGTDLLFFERAQRRGGLWRFQGAMICATVKTEPRPDIDGGIRTAIVFGLIPLDVLSTTSELVNELEDETSTEPDADDRLEETEVSTVQAIRRVFIRARVVKEQALRRASGRCEACGNPAPFLRSTGEPYLEVHHIDRLADGGPDRIDRFAALCSNCHARCHYSVDSTQFNAAVRQNIRSKEPPPA